MKRYIVVFWKWNEGLTLGQVSKDKVVAEGIAANRGGVVYEIDIEE